MVVRSAVQLWWPGLWYAAVVMARSSAAVAVTIRCAAAMEVWSGLQLYIGLLQLVDSSGVLQLQ
jgi:hypothetical protein